MYSRASIVSDKNINDDIYRFQFVLNEKNKLDLKIMHMAFDQIGEDYSKSDLMIPKSVEILEPTNQLIAKLCGSNYPILDVDPYIRTKLCGSPLYTFLYDSKLGLVSRNIKYGKTVSLRTEHEFNEQETYLINLINLSSKDLNYLYHLSEDINGYQEDTFDELLTQCVFPKTTKNRNSRKRLGISKSKEKAIKLLKQPFLLKYENEMFDDDIDFLVNIISEIDVRQVKTFLHKIMHVKSLNKNLKFEDIVRKICKYCLKSNKKSLSREAIDNFDTQAFAYESLISGGLNPQIQKLKLLDDWKMIFFSENDTLKPSDNIPFCIDGYEISKFLTRRSLYYANAMTKAYTISYIRQGIETGSEFFLVYNKRRMVLAEYRHGIVISAKRHFNEVMINVSYKE